MTITWTNIVLIVCVCIVASGQLLFKYVADLGHATKPIYSIKFLAILGLALGLYAAAAFLWIWLLQFTSLARAYPFMALSFILVPVGSWYFFGESINVGYGVGVVMIFCGLITINMSTNT